MRSSTDRILVSHAGTLPRPPDLQEIFDKGPEAQAEYEAALPEAVGAVVARQAAIGIDIVNDGEFPKRGTFSGYIRDRMSGIEERPDAGGPRNAGVTGRDRRDFPDFYADGLGAFRAGLPPLSRSVFNSAPSYATDKIAYTGHDVVTADIARLKAACAGLDVELYLPAVSPGTIEHWLLPDDSFADQETFLFAIADVMREEYKAITDAGVILQIDDPDLPDAWQMFPDMSVEEYRRYAAVRVAAQNHALRDLPRDLIRFHVCWGSQHGPHRDDIPLAAIVDLVLSVTAGCYSFEAANVRHEHEWRVWDDVELPDGATIMPGVVGHATDIIEHPEVVAQRLVRFAQAVGRDVIAGTDCGLGGRVHREIAWAKLEELAKGAEIASAELWR